MSEIMSKVETRVEKQKGKSVSYKGAKAGDLITQPPLEDHRDLSLHGISMFLEWERVAWKINKCSRNGGLT